MQTTTTSASFSQMFQQELSKLMKEREFSDLISINFAEELASMTNISKRSRSLNLQSWIVDSGAISHICSNPNLLTNIRRHEEYTPMSLPDNTI